MNLYKAWVARCSSDPAGAGPAPASKNEERTGSDARSRPGPWFLARVQELFQSFEFGSPSYDFGKTSYDGFPVAADDFAQFVDRLVELVHITEIEVVWRRANITPPPSRVPVRASRPDVPALNEPA